MLKPNTAYHFSDADLQFVLELAKVGHVHLLSSQVTLTQQGNSSSNPCLSFKEYAGKDGTACKGLSLPQNWVIENIYANERQLTITFEVSKN